MKILMLSVFIIAMLPLVAHAADLPSLKMLSTPT